MPLQLRDYQTAMLDATRDAARASKSVLLCAPTGSGKTVVGAAFAARARAMGKRVLFTVHRDFLIEQTSLAFQSAGLPHTILAAGRKADYAAPAMIASIGSLRSKLDRLQGADLLIIDEAAHAVAETWAKTIRHFQSRGAFVLGLTATPWRMNGAGLGTIFGALALGPPVSWLIEHGYLSDYRAFVPPAPDLTGIRTRMGEYEQDALAQRMDTRELTGDAVDHYTRITPGRRALVFAVNVAHSRHLAERFAAAGARAEHLDATTPKDERAAIVERFRAGVTRVLCSVEIFGEGFDSPACDVVILCRPTKSLALHLQQIGRGMRPAEGKDRLTILDHAGNVQALGFPDDARAWTLADGVKKIKGPAAIKQCPECFAAYRGAVCPECGHRVVIKPAKIDKRLSGNRGELVEAASGRVIDMPLPPLRDALAGAKTQADIVAIGRARGYKPGWAFHIFRARGGRQ